jgi:hypothetical protein
MGEWPAEVDEVKKFLDQFGGHLPEGLRQQWNALAKQAGK